MNVEIKSPFPIECAPRLWSWIQPFKDRVSDDFGPQTLGEFVPQFMSKCAGQTTWGVYGDGELAGLITFERLNPWIGTAHIILKPSFHGKGLALRASEMAIAAMFETGIGKLCFYPMARGNTAMGSMLVSMGARREGLLRAQTLCDGAPQDIVVYGLMKEEFKNNALRSSSASALGSGSIDIRVDSGQQKTDSDQHHNADVIAGNEGAARSAAGV